MPKIMKKDVTQMRKRIKKAILLAVSYIMGAVFMLSLAMIDSGSVIASILLILSALWLILIAKAYDWGDAVEIQYRKNGE